MIDQLAATLQPLLGQCAEEQIEAIAEAIARELLSREDGTMNCTLAFSLKRTPKHLDVKARFKFSTPFSSPDSEASAEIDFDQQKMELE